MNMKKSLDQLLRDSLDQAQQLPPVDDFWQDFAQRLDGNGTEGRANDAAPAPQTTVPEAPLPTASGNSSAVKSWMVIGAAVAGLALLRFAVKPDALTQEAILPPSGMVQSSPVPNAPEQKDKAATLSLYPSLTPQTDAIGSNSSTPQVQIPQISSTASARPKNIVRHKSAEPFSDNQNNINTFGKSTKGDDRQNFAKGRSKLGANPAAAPIEDVSPDPDSPVKTDQKAAPNTGKKQPAAQQPESVKPQNGPKADQANAPNLPENAAPVQESTTAASGGNDKAKEEVAESVEPAPKLGRQWQVPDLGRREWSGFDAEKQVPDFSKLAAKEKVHGKANPLTAYAFLGTEPFYSQRYQPNVFQLLSVGMGLQRPMRNDWAIRAEAFFLQTEGLPVSVTQTTIIDPDGKRTTEERIVDVYRMNRLALNLSAVKRIGSVSLLGGLSLGRWVSGQVYESFSSKSEIFGGTSSGYSSGGGPLPSDYFNQNYLGLKLGVEINPFDSRWLAGASFYQQANDLTRSARWTANQDFMLYVGWKF